MDRYLAASQLLAAFENGLNPLPEVQPDTDLIIRLGGADRDRLEAYFQLYSIRVNRQELRLFADGSDQVYVIAWPGPMLNVHWKQRLPTTRRARAKSSRAKGSR